MFKFLKVLVLSVMTGLGLMSAQAYAALPAGVTSAITDATTDGVALGGLMLALAVAVGVIFWLKRKV